MLFEEKLKKIAVLTSGNSRGSNFQAIADNINKSEINISFVVVTSRKAPIIEKCEAMSISWKFISAKKLAAFESELLDQINEHEIDLIVLAGFMRQISEDFISRCGIPILNIHPALLPEYGGKGMYGSNVHKAVFENKEKLSGATVHYVNENYDEGKIVLQESVDISECRGADEIAKKVLRIEHSLYYRAIEKVLGVE